MPGHYIESLNTPEFTPTSKTQEDFRIKHKTEICKAWQLGKSCEFNDKCSFAHGSNELKKRYDTHKKYKTRPCKKYATTGNCPYGQRCQFRHDVPTVTSIDNLDLVENVKIEIGKVKK